MNFRKPIFVFNILLLIFCIFLFPIHQSVILIIERNGRSIILIVIEAWLILNILVFIKLIEESRIFIGWILIVIAVIWVSAIRTRIIVISFLFILFGYFIPHNFYVGLINYFIITYLFFIWNRNWYLSDNRHFLNVWCRHGYCSSYRNSFKHRILYMIDVILLVIFLYYGLSNYLFSWNSYSFGSCDIANNDWFSNSIELYLSIISSINL